MDSGTPEPGSPPPNPQQSDDPGTQPRWSKRHPPRLEVSRAKRSRKVAHPRQLDQPVELVSRQIAAALLEKCARECARLSDAHDAEALHDFRVSVRRLRTWMEAYESYFDKGVVKKMRKQLGALMTSTNSARDNEVHLAWLKEQQGRRIARLEREGYAIAFDLFLRQSPDAEVAAGGLQAEFEKLRQKFAERLTAPREPILVNEQGESHRFGRAAGDTVRARADVVGQSLAVLETMDQLKRAHQARLSAKRLRYVMEPLRDTVPGTRGVVKRLTALQDQLGDLHDLQTLEAALAKNLKRSAREWSRDLIAGAAAETRISDLKRRLPQHEDMYASAAAIQAVRRAQQRVFNSISNRWLGDASSSFFEQIDRIVARLS